MFPQFFFPSTSFAAFECVLTKEYSSCFRGFGFLWDRFCLGGCKVALVHHQHRRYRRCCCTLFKDLQRSSRHEKYRARAAVRQDRIDFNLFLDWLSFRLAFHCRILVILRFFRILLLRSARRCCKSPGLLSCTFSARCTGWSGRGYSR